MPEVVIAGVEDSCSVLSSTPRSVSMAERVMELKDTLDERGGCAIKVSELGVTVGASPRAAASS